MCCLPGMQSVRMGQVVCDCWQPRSWTALMQRREDYRGDVTIVFQYIKGFLKAIGNQLFSISEIQQEEISA